MNKPTETKPKALNRQDQLRSASPPRWKKHQRRANDGTEDGFLALYGIHTVAAALANPVRQKHRLLVTPNAKARLQDELVKSGASAESMPDSPKSFASTPVETVTATSLSKRLGREAVHQGCLLECTPLPAESRLNVSQIARALVLDQITDPHNVGAILRSAAAFAVDAVITTARHSPAETGVLAKSASGALDHVPLIRVRNLGEALTKMQDTGIALIGLDSEGLASLGDIACDQPYALVLGAEGKGLRRKTRSLCTHLARLDMPGTISSLNVSNAAAIALYAARTKEGCG